MLYNTGVGTQFVNKKADRVVCSLFINCTNLTNVAYVDHLSHEQYFRAYNASPVTVTQLNQGIYNMGRNLGIKLNFPFGHTTIKASEEAYQGGEY